MLDENLISPRMIIEVKNSDQRDELISIIESHGANTFKPLFGAFPQCIRISASGGVWAWHHQHRHYYEQAYSGLHIYEFEELEADDACFDEFASMWDEINAVL